jgi:hypothetical protein
MKYLTITLLILFSLNLSGQNTFSKYSQLSSLGAELYEVYVTDSCYYILGISVSRQAERDINVYKTDFNGNVIDANSLKDSLIIHTWPGTGGTNPGTINTPKMDDSGEIIFCTNTTKKGFPGIEHPTFVRYNVTGEVVDYNQYHLIPDSQEIACDIDRLSDSSSIHLTNKYISLPGGFVKYLFSLKKWDSSGQFVWKEDFENGNIISANCLATNKGKIYIGVSSGNLGIRQKDYESKITIFEFDSLGKYNRHYDTPDSLLYINVQEIIPTPDKGLIIAAQAGKEIRDSSSTSSGLWYQGRIMKLDSSFHMEWEISVDTFSFFNGLKGLSQLPDNSFLLYGISYHIFDTIPLGSICPWVAKISSSGDSLWTRHIVHSIHTRTGRLFGGKGTNDGGILMVGKINEYNVNSGLRNNGAWWVKLDSMGCLVPGCHLNTGIHQPEDFRLDFSLYPNPVKDQLFVHIQNPDRHQLTIQILNASGQILQADKLLTFADLTQGFSVESLAAGIYFVRLFSEDGHSQMKKFVIE